MAKKKKRTSYRKGAKKYTVVLPFSIGSGDNKVDYFVDETIYLKPFEAQQFINAQKIK